MKKWGIIFVLAGLLTGCGGGDTATDRTAEKPATAAAEASEPARSSACEMMVSAGVSRGAGMEDVDRALRGCPDLAAFEAATAKHPGLIDGTDAATIVQNRCKYNAQLADYPICK